MSSEISSVDLENVPAASDDTARLRVLSDDTPNAATLETHLVFMIENLVDVHRELLIQMATVLEALREAIEQNRETLEQNREAISLVAQIAADNADDPEYDLEGNRVNYGERNG